ncbi:MAG: ATPase, T2SS/T4P/T4SS family [Acidobacteriota bacterium]
MSKQLESILRESGLLTETQLARDIEQARRQNTSLFDVIFQDETISEDQVADLFEARLRTARIRVAASSIDPDAISKVPEKLARRHICLPISIAGRVLTLAMADPGDYEAIQDVEFASGLSVRPVVATRTEIADGIEERYATQDRIGAFLANVPDVTDLHIVVEDSPQDLMVAVADSRSASDVAPVIKMCNLIVHDSIKSGASDTHIEPTMHDVNVRMRVDGVLRDYTHVPKWLHNPLISRLKILARLDIAERRLPQDGRINVHYQGRSIDIRVSTLPTHFGEKVVLRYLGGGTLPKVDRMGLNEIQAAILDDVIRQPQGMILVTGPTGSGKTTTLYALLAKRRSPEVNIVTVEDPIEYQLPGINQVQINPKAGLSFAGVLRSILRQDPDVILVGETRDQETAEVAFQAAMTGHLVLSTLHTNSAVAALPRLSDLEVDPNILATSLTLVIAQRLVRRICSECKEAYLPDPATALKVGLSPADGSVYRGKGCSACGGTGFNGRVGIYEMFRPTNAIRKLISARASETDLKAAARQGGMRLLREDALDKVKQGITSPDEVLRVVQVDESETPCSRCGALIEADFSTCPYCLSSLKHTCASCGQDLKIEWKACPYCNAAAIPPAAIPPAAEPAAFVPSPAETASADQLELRQPAAAGALSPGAISPVRAPGVGAGAAGSDLKEAATDAMSWPGVRTFDFDAAALPSPDLVTEISDGSGLVPLPLTARLPELPPTVGSHRDRSESLQAGTSLPPPYAFDDVANPPAPASGGARTRRKPVPPGPSLLPDLPPVVPPPPASSSPGPVESTPTFAAPPPRVKPQREEPLPVLVDVPPPVVPRPVAPPPPATASEPVVRRLRVLVVDDDDDIRQVVAFTLKKLVVPVDVAQAVDGQEAVEMAEAAPPDLVILDVMMPRMDGFETCARLRQTVRTAFVPILMLTASADEASRSKGYLVGTDDYMSKPFQPLDLKLRVTRLLRRTYGV